MITDRIIQSYGYPNNENDLWLDLNDGVLKRYYGGQWVSVAGSSAPSGDDSSDGGDGGKDVEANVAVPAGTTPTALSNLKVGDIIFSVPPALLIVHGDYTNDGFEPNEGEPSFEDAYKAFKSGIPVFISVSGTGDGVEYGDWENYLRIYEATAGAPYGAFTSYDYHLIAGSDFEWIYSSDSEIV